MNEMEDKHTITLTDEQFDAVADACEWVSRFLAGQVDDYTLPAGLRFSDRFESRRDSITQALQNLKAHLFPEFGASHAYYGVGADQDAEPIARSRVVLYEVYRTMLEYRTQRRIADGQNVGHSVYAHPGLNFTGLPKPNIQAIDKTLLICVDGGTCHHDCGMNIKGSCYRRRHCAPLAGYKGEW